MTASGCLTGSTRRQGSDLEQEVSWGGGAKLEVAAMESHKNQMSDVFVGVLRRQRVPLLSVHTPSQLRMWPQMCA